MATLTAPRRTSLPLAITLGPCARVPLALRLTFGNRSRFLHAALAGAAVVALVVGQAATMAGLLMTPRWVRATGASVWVTTAANRPGWTPVPAGLATKVAGLDGVESVTEVTRQMAEAVVTGEANAAILVAWDPGKLDAPLVAGRTPAKGDEVVLDAGYAAGRGVGLGSAIALRVGDHSAEVEVVGLGRGLSLLNFQVVLCVPDVIRTVFGAGSAGATSAAAAGDLDHLASSLNAAEAPLREAEGPLGWTSGADKLAATREVLQTASGDAVRAAASLRAAAEVMSPPEANSLALRVAPGREEEVAKRIRSMPELLGSVDAHSAAHEEHLVLANTAAPFLPVLAAVVGLVLGLGCVVMALLLLGMVGESNGDYATLAAIGAGSGRIARVVFAQCLLAAFTAGVLGVAVGAALVAVMRQAMPMLPLACTPSVLGAGIGVAVAMGVVASVAPLRSLRHIEPASVFRA